MAKTLSAKRIDALLVGLSAASGCAALIYEIVWFQMVQLIIGSSAVSLGVIVATFMGELCIGSLMVPRLVAPRHPWRRPLLPTGRPPTGRADPPWRLCPVRARSTWRSRCFELLKQHLNPGGVITQWVPLYESTTAAVKSEIATIFEVFPDGALWINELRGRGSDVVLSAQATPAAVDVDAVNRRLTRPEYSRVLKSLHDVKFKSGSELFATYMAQKSDLADWLADATINTDRNLRVQYLAGMGMGRESDYSIYAALCGARSHPPSLFAGSPQSMQALLGEIDRQSRRLRIRMH